MSGRLGRRRSFGARVRAALLSAAAIGIVITAVVFYLYWAHNVLTLRTAELKRQVSVIAAGISVSDIVPGSAQDLDQTRSRLLNVEAGIIGARLVVADEQGEVLFSTAGKNALSSYPLRDLAPGKTVYDARAGVTAVSGAGRIIVVAVPVAFSESNEPSRYLVGSRMLSELGAADSWVAIAMGAAALAALVVAWLLGSLLMRRVTEPLRRLTEGAQEIAAGHWGRQVAVEGDDETAELARAFNEMSSRTEATYRAQQAFVSDVSHEIRTPVTSIGGFATAIADGTLRDADGVARAGRIIAAEAGRLTEITSALLSLADLEAGAVALASAPVDPGGLAFALRDRFSIASARRDIRLDIDLGAVGPVADEARLLQALSALVDNAVHYASGHVSVSGTVASGTWTVRVDDDGPGIPPQDRERVFGRFARLDGARSPGGTGLGLAICRRLVELMRGTVRVETSASLGGASFVIELPASSGAPRAGATETQHAFNQVPTNDADSDREGGHPPTTR